MFSNLFKKRCPICKMEVKEGSIEGFGKKFCSEACRELYRRKLMGGPNISSGSSCH